MRQIILPYPVNINQLIFKTIRDFFRKKIQISNYLLRVFHWNALVQEKTGTISIKRYLIFFYKFYFSMCFIIIT